MKKQFQISEALDSRVPTGRARVSGGFSLVEVTLALGIVAFAMIPLLALLPAGLSASHASMENTIFTQVISRISSDVQKLPFSKVDTYAGQTLTFDANGVKTDKDVVYKVTMKSLAPSYPGAEQLSGIKSQFKQIEITISPSTVERALYITTIPVSNSGYEGS